MVQSFELASFSESISVLFMEKYTWLITKRLFRVFKGSECILQPLAPKKPQVTLSDNPNSPPQNFSQAGPIKTYV